MSGVVGAGLIGNLSYKRVSDRLIERRRAGIGLRMIDGLIDEEKCVLGEGDRSEQNSYD